MPRQRPDLHGAQPDRALSLGHRPDKVRPRYLMGIVVFGLLVRAVRDIFAEYGFE